MREKHLNEVEAQRTGELAPTNTGSGRESSTYVHSTADRRLPMEVRSCTSTPLEGAEVLPGPLRSLLAAVRTKAHYLAAPGAFLEFARDRADRDSLVLELPSPFRQRWSKLRAAARCAARIGVVNQRLIWVVNGLTGVWIVAPTARLRREPVVLIFRDSAPPGRRRSLRDGHWQRTGLRVYAMAPSNYGLATLVHCMRVTPLGVVPNAVTKHREARSGSCHPVTPKIGWIGSRRRVKGSGRRDSDRWARRRTSTLHWLVLRHRSRRERRPIRLRG